MSFYRSPEDMHLGRDKKMPTSSQLCYSLSLASASLAVETLLGVQCSQAALPVGDRTMWGGQLEHREVKQMAQVTQQGGQSARSFPWMWRFSQPSLLLQDAPHWRKSRCHNHGCWRLDGRRQ